MKSIRQKTTISTVRVKQVVPGVITNHRMIHREALASKPLLASLNLVLQELIKIVNFVKVVHSTHVSIETFV